MSTKSSLNFTFWKFLEHSVLRGKKAKSFCCCHIARSSWILGVTLFASVQSGHSSCLHLAVPLKLSSEKFSAFSQQNWAVWPNYWEILDVTNTWELRCMQQQEQVSWLSKQNPNILLMKISSGLLFHLFFSRSIEFAEILFQFTL